MRILRVAVSTVHEAEAGHVKMFPGYAASAAGMIALGIGAANDMGWLAIAGGIVAGLGLLAGIAISHDVIDYDIYRRLDDLEKK